MRQIFSLSVLHLGVCCMCLLLATSAVHAQRIVGRVVDSTGAPVERAAIRVWRKVSDVNGRSENELLRIDGVAQWKTDGDGRFETPEIGEETSVVRVVAQAEGLLAGRSGWLSAADTTRIDSGKIVLSRLHSVEGRVVDRNGQPVGGVIVFNSGDAHQRVEAKSDSMGRFVLPGLPQGQVCLFAEHPNHRFTGMVAPSAAEGVELVLPRYDEDVEPIHTLPAPLPGDEAKQLGRRVVDAYLDAAANDGDTTKMMSLFALSWLDSLAAIERIDAMSFSDREEQQRVREEIVFGAIQWHDFDDWNDLHALIESAGAPESKAACYTCAARHLFAGDRAGKRQLLAESLLHARAVFEPKRRALELVRIAVTLFDLDQGEEAKSLTREALAVLDPLPISHRVSWNVTGTVAEALARFDVAAARALLDRLHYDHIFAYELGRVACAAALCDVAQAERLWKESSDRPTIGPDDLEWRNSELLAPFCYRQAKRDVAAALRIARAFDDVPTRTEALAAVARALAESDANAARRLARQTLAEQPTVGLAGRRWNHMYTEAVALCQWLPLLETLDPQLGREFLWRAVALRPLRPVAESLDDEVAMAEIALIGLVARYDRRLAETLLAPYLARFDELAAASTSIVGLTISNVALVDPRIAANLIDRLPEPRDGNRDRAYGWPRLMWMNALAADDHIRWQLGYRDPSRYESW
ncbi:MAG TPA: carboxypeptidase-like regulatory domain-containing protein [Pirellulales bacterium]